MKPQLSQNDYIVRLALLGSGLSLIYLIFFFLFASRDSPLFSKTSLTWAVHIYSLLGILIGYSLIRLEKGTWNPNWGNDDQTDILDAPELDHAKIVGGRFDLIVHYLNLGAYFGLFFMSFWGDVIWAAVLSLVWGLLWVILGLGFWEAFKQSR